MYHGYQQLPSLQEIARVLPNGRVYGDKVRFQDPRDGQRKPNRRQCTLWLINTQRDGWTTSSAARPGHDDIELKDIVRKLVPGLGPFQPRSNKANGKTHRPAGGPVVGHVASNGAAALGEGGDRASRSPPPRIYLVPLDAIRLGTTRRYLIKGMIPRIGMIVGYSPPKSGKSFLAFDLCMHIAMGKDYRGRRTHQGPAIYCYFEGQDAASARVEAFRQTHMAESAQDVPFYLMPVTINLVDEHEELIAAIDQECPKPVIVTLDTLNRSFVGSESSDQDMTAYVRAADAIRDAFGCAVLIVHHCGHDASRPRGHTALIGAADAVIGVKKEREGTLVATVEMMKDGPAGEVIGGRLKQVVVGQDEDGDPITSCVVEPVEVAARPSGPKPTKLNASEQLALKALQYAISEVGKSAPSSNHIFHTLPRFQKLWKQAGRILQVAVELYCCAAAREPVRSKHRSLKPEVPCKPNRADPRVLCR